MRNLVQVGFAFHGLPIVVPARLGGRVGPLLPSFCQGCEQCRLQANRSFVLVHTPVYSIFDAEPFTGF
jgi:hypothetical protein